MPRRRVKAVVRKHRIVRRRSEADAIAVQHRAVELHVVRDQGFRWVGEQGTEHVDERRVDIPRLPLRRRERKANQLARLRVRCRQSRLARRRLRIEGDARCLHQLGQKRLRLRLRRDVAIVVGRGRERGKFRSAVRLARGIGKEGLVSAAGGDAPRYGISAAFHPKLLCQTIEFELRADSRELLGVDAVKLVRIPVGLDRHIRANRRQELRDRRIVASREDLFGKLALELHHIRENALDTAEVRQQLRRRLLADAADTWNVVRRVTRERQIVDHLRGRGKMPVFADLLLVVDLGGVARVGGTVELHARTNELGGVLIRCRHVDVEAGGRALDGKRPHHVVGLEAVDAHDGNLQRLGELERIGDGRRQVLGHLLALRLVGGVRLVAERGTARIHREDRVRRTLLPENGLQSVRKPQQCGRVDTARRHARIAQEDEVSLVQERHQIDDEKLAHVRQTVSRTCKSRRASGPPRP